MSYTRDSHPDYANLEARYLERRIGMTMKWAFWAFTLACVSAAESHNDTRVREGYLGKYPVYAIPVRQENSHDTLDETDPHYFSTSRPYAHSRPTPFYYKQDVDYNRSVLKLRKVEPFLVGGINCDESIRKNETISGVPFDSLQERVKGDPQRSQFDSRMRPGWEGANNIGLRSSGDGFIKPGQRFRELLLSDNQLVRAMKLTHQKIAEPILVGIEALHQAVASEMAISASRSEASIRGEVPFNYGGEEYTISRLAMGGAIKLFPIPKTEEEEEKRAQTFLDRIRARPSGTAWVGAGVQGSVFNDELFEDFLFTIKRKKDGKTLTRDMLTPHLIYRYGFYQGGEYRIDPKEIAEFFHLKGEQGKAWEERDCPK